MNDLDGDYTISLLQGIEQSLMHLNASVVSTGSDYVDVGIGVTSQGSCDGLVERYMVECHVVH